MVRATHRKMDQPPEARPGAVKDTAMERRGAQVLHAWRASHRKGAIQDGRLAALHPLGYSRGTERGSQAAPGLQRTGAMSHVQGPTKAVDASHPERELRASSSVVPSVLSPEGNSHGHRR